MFDIPLLRGLPGGSMTCCPGGGLTCHGELPASRSGCCSPTTRIRTLEPRATCRSGSSRDSISLRRRGKACCFEEEGFGRKTQPINTRFSANLGGQLSSASSAMRRRRLCCFKEEGFDRNTTSFKTRSSANLGAQFSSALRRRRYLKMSAYRRGQTRSEEEHVDMDTLSEERSYLLQGRRDSASSGSNGRGGNGASLGSSVVHKVVDKKPATAIVTHGASRGGAPTLFGVEMTPDTIAIAMVYFVQGVLGISRLAVTFFLKDDLGLDPAEVGILTGFASLPWLVKPAYGFISDGLPLFGYRRRSYLVLCGIVGAIAWGSLAFFVADTNSFVVAILFSSLSVAFSDVVVDSMVVERARGESQSLSGSLQSLCWGSLAFGGIVSAYSSGALVEAHGARFVFGVTALLPLITSAVAGIVQEERMDLPPVVTHHLVHHSEIATSAPSEGGSSSGSGGSTPPREGVAEIAREQLLYLWETIREPAVLLPTLFIFFWQATPHSETAMLYFNTNVLHVGPEFLGRVRLVSSVASLAGVVIYNAFLKKVPLRRIFLANTLIGTALGLTQVLLVTRTNVALGISDEWFMLGDSLILSVLGQISFMPVLVLAARICPEGVEATLFATLMSISNAANVSGHFLGSSLTQYLGITSTNFDKLVLLLVLTNLSSLLALPFLGLLPKEEEEGQPPEEEEMVAIRTQGPSNPEEEV